MMQGQGTLRLDTWLSKLLWAVAMKQGGVLRVPGVDLEDAPDKCAITTDYDKATHELVIRAYSGVSSMIVINTEQQWTTRQTPSETSPPTSQPTPQTRSNVLDDEGMARIEQRLMQRAAERQDRHRRSEETAAMQEL